VDWAKVTAALREVGYDGPLTYEGGGDPGDVLRRLLMILGA
jgi:sugar phosphate isomerase/epimerase